MSHATGEGSGGRRAATIEATVDGSSASRDLALPADAQMRSAATGFALLADPSRLRVLWVLAHGPADVTTLANVTGVRATAVSQHLAKLRLAGLVDAQRDGRRQIYTVRGGHVRRLVLEALGHADHQVAGIPDHD